MKKLIWLAAAFLAVFASHAQMSMGPWIPTYKGIEFSTGTNWPDGTTPIPRRQSVQCARVDLSDPDVQLLATPRAPGYVSNSVETLSLTVSNFLKNNNLKVATDANFYSPGDPNREGLASTVKGLQISKGEIISGANDPTRACSLLFTTNKDPMFVFVNNPGTNTAGVYTAITGFYPVLTNGVNLWSLYFSQLSAAYPDTTVHQVQPRTAIGVSQDGRYLFLMTIDGRQSNYSDGALDAETGMWLLQFGAWNAINMDGGGSTSMYRADCAGLPIAVNHSSYVAQQISAGRTPRERYIGSHFGVSAKPLPGFISDVTPAGNITSAIINWSTLATASSQVEYGLTPSYGLTTPLDAAPLLSHAVTLNGLTPGTTYFFRVISTNTASQERFEACGSFSTTNEAAITGTIFELTNPWRYATSNMDSTPAWKNLAYNDTNNPAWTAGQGVLWVDTANSGGGNPAIQFLPLRTQMPASTTYPYITYYFRTHFNFSNNPVGATLTFSNYVDDGLVIYLNGTEIYRAYLTGSPVANSTLASGYYCTGGNATCPMVFTVPSSALTNLNRGDNVLAVEVHNYNPSSPDITFGSALFFTAVPPVPPPPFIANLVVSPGETSATIAWTTLSNSTTQVRYGPTAALGTSTPLDATLATSHTVTLTNLARTNQFYFQAVSVWGTNIYTTNGFFSTVPFYQGIVELTNIWRYTTNNLDGVNWQAPGFSDASWPAGSALFYAEPSSTPNPLVQPKSTQLPMNPATQLPWTTYYFRTHFTVTNLPSPGFTLVLSNFIDDGAVFYLNGNEIQRVRMPWAPFVITNATEAWGHPPGGDAIDPEVLRFWGSPLTNLVIGDNLLAVEVHNYPASSTDVTFGSAIGLVRALSSETSLRAGRSADVFSIGWDGGYLILQQSTNVAATNAWQDVPGPVTISPFNVTNPAGSMYYRLRN